MGLLDMNQQGMPQQGQMQGGLLGNGMPQQVQPQSNEGAQMLDNLIKNPTPQVVQMVASKLQSKGVEGAKMAQVLMGLSDNPQGIVNFATQILQQIQGGQNA